MAEHVRYGRPKTFEEYVKKIREERSSLSGGDFEFLVKEVSALLLEVDKGLQIAAEWGEKTPVTFTKVLFARSDGMEKYNDILAEKVSRSAILSQRVPAVRKTKAKYIENGVQITSLTLDFAVSE